MTYIPRIKNYLKENWKRNTLGLLGLGLSVFGLYQAMSYTGKAYQEIETKCVRPKINPEIKETYRLASEIESLPRNSQEETVDNLERLLQIYKSDSDLTKKIQKYNADEINYYKTKTQLENKRFLKDVFAPTLPIALWIISGLYLCGPLFKTKNEKEVKIKDE